MAAEVVSVIAATRKADNREVRTYRAIDRGIVQVVVVSELRVCRRQQVETEGGTEQAREGMSKRMFHQTLFQAAAQDSQDRRTVRSGVVRK